ncbi:MAG TPA: CDP-alcohol phosphatidyltransferase family protein [Flavobacterium sp.]|uniref:CDP-alcohol phosphatidyltransferase family protein n=1 Tax=Flavobacterium sp. TaxID=239 RepID=UPI002B5C6035|nr:CDP-alcohol phosphatidyltransferase family protein [Flavobacterium sp.]HSD14714.1 CDP-alcohol phosphatidyltransferase family protein [Flavobacterium sp.]
MKHQIPKALIFSRLIIGFAIIAFSCFHIDNYEIVAITLLTIGLLTDIFDGIVARQLNISTQKLRRLDSTVDQVFFVSVAVATYIQCPDFFASNVLKLTLLIGVEALTYVVSFLKFRKEIATHSIGAKIWTLFLFATLIQIMMQCESTILFDICFWLGILTRLEIIAIILTLKEWTTDVPSFYHALQLRQGKNIKRHKMFNG